MLHSKTFDTRGYGPGVLGQADGQARDVSDDTAAGGIYEETRIEMSSRRV